MSKADKQLKLEVPVMLSQEDLRMVVEWYAELMSIRGFRGPEFALAQRFVTHHNDLVTHREKKAAMPVLKRLNLRESRKQILKDNVPAVFESVVPKTPQRE